MKISFKARFTDIEHRRWMREKELNDKLLSFLPSRLEVVPIKNTGHLHEPPNFGVKMEVSNFFSLEDLVEKMAKLGISVSKITEVKREFTKEELEEIKKMVCFKEIFTPTEGKMKA